MNFRVVGALFGRVEGRTHMTLYRKALGQSEEAHVAALVVFVTCNVSREFGATVKL